MRKPIFVVTAAWGAASGALAALSGLSVDLIVLALLYLTWLVDKGYHLYYPRDTRPTTGTVPGKPAKWLKRLWSDRPGPVWLCVALLAVLSALTVLTWLRDGTLALRLLALWCVALAAGQLVLALEATKDLGQTP